MNQIKNGEFMSSQRKVENLTQTALAEKLGITDRAVSKWERGKGIPDASLMVDLCEILGITVNELLCGEKYRACLKNRRHRLFAHKRPSSVSEILANRQVDLRFSS